MSSPDNLDEWMNDPDIMRQLHPTWFAPIVDNSIDDFLNDPDVMRELHPTWFAPIIADDGDWMNDPDVMQQLHPELFDWHPMQEGGRLADHVEISRTYDQHVRSLNTVAIAFSARFHRLNEVDDLNGLVHHALNRLIRSIDDPQPNDRVGMEIRHPGLHHSIIVPFQRFADLNTAVILRLYDEVMQSNEHVNLDEGLEAKIVHVKAPQGGMPKRTFRGDFDTFYAGHGSHLMKIDNADQLCCARAIVTAKSRWDHQTDPQNVDLLRLYDSIRQGDRGRHTRQKRAATDLHRRANVAEGPCGIPELRLFQAVLPEYRIRVWSKVNFFRV